MSNKKPDIDQLRKYLNGDLDARAMHQLERQAQEDPFLMEAMEGYDIPGHAHQKANLTALDNMLKQRIAQKKVRKLNPFVYAVAASVLILLTLGYWLWPSAHQTTVQQQGKLAQQQNRITTLPDTAIATQKQQSLIAANKPAHPAPALRLNKQPIIRADTKTGIAENILKKMPGIQVDSVSNAIAYVQPANRAMLSRNAYVGSDKQQQTDISKPGAAVIEQTKASKKDTSAYAVTYYTPVANDTSKALREVTVGGFGTAKSKNSDRPAAMSAQTLPGKAKGLNVPMPDGRIRGVIIDPSGLPLPGVSVLIAGTRTSTITDAQGRFSLSANGNKTLSVGSIGYQSQLVNVGLNDSVKIALQPQANSLSEVVAIGYGKPVKPDKHPHPRSGWANYRQYLQQGAVVNNNDATGTVRLSFTVGTHGELSDFQVTKSLNQQADQQAINLVKKGTGWVPAASGQPETVKLKITFTKSVK